MFEEVPVDLKGLEEATVTISRGELVVLRGYDYLDGVGGVPAEVALEMKRRLGNFYGYKILDCFGSEAFKDRVSGLSRKDLGLIYEALKFT